MKLRHIKYRKQGPLAWIVLDRPQARNAFTREMMDSCHAALKDARDDQAVKVIMLMGEGESFCAGGDIKEMARGELTSWDMQGYLREHVQQIPLMLEDMDKPVLAVVNGAAAGGGFDLALACDMRLASEKATFCASFIRIGLAPGDGGAYFLPRLVGMARALEILLTGRIIPAREALSLGLVNRVVPHHALREEAEKLALEIAQWPLVAIRAVKRAAYQAAHSSLRAHLDYMSFQLGLLTERPEHRQAIRNLVDKKGE